MPWIAVAIAARLKPSDSASEKADRVMAKVSAEPMAALRASRSYVGGAFSTAIICHHIGVKASCGKPFRQATGPASAPSGSPFVPAVTLAPLPCPITGDDVE